MHRTSFPVNFRAFAVVAIFVIAAVASVYVYMLNRIAGIILGCAVVTVAVVLFAVFLIKLSNHKIKLRVVLSLGISILFSVCAFGIGASSYDKWNECSAFSGYNNVVGRVCAVDTRHGAYRLELDSLVIGNSRADGNMLIKLKASDSDIVELLDYGDILIFSAYVEHEKLIRGNYVNGYGYRTNIRYSATVDPQNIKIEFGAPKPLEGFLSSVHKLMVENMGDREGNIAFSMLTGDKHSLFGDITDTFSAAGLGHILAVSGLHIGFIILLLSFLMSKLDKRIRIPIIFVVVLGYVILADFSPSVIRAALMAAVSGSALFCGGRRDMFSSLLAAFSAILAVKPLYLFDVGFLLSFGAIYGIALFSNTIKRKLVKHGVRDKIGNAIGASVSVTLGIVPSEIYFFGRVSLIGIIANAILLPYISSIFIITLCLLPIAAIPECGQVLTVVKYLFTVIDYIVYGLSQIPFAAVSLSASSSVFLCYPIMFFASDYYMMERGKAAVVLYSVIVCTIIIALCAI